MICERFKHMVGMRCNPLRDDAVEVVTPFTFADGDGIEVFAQEFGPSVHFFDDGFTLFHLHGAGIDLGHDRKRWKPLKAIAQTHGVTLSDDGVFEILTSAENAAHAFACLVSTLLGIASWEREQSPKGRIFSASLPEGSNR